MNNRNIIIAIEWPGQWASAFTRDAENKLTAKAGQQPILQIQVTPHEKDTAYVESFLKAGIKSDICLRYTGWYQMDSSYYKGDEK